MPDSRNSSRKKHICHTGNHSLQNTTARLPLPQWKMVGINWASLRQLYSVKKIRQHVSDVTRPSQEKLVQSLSSVSQWGSSQPVVPFRSSSRCVGRGFSMNSHYLKYGYSIPSVSQCGGNRLEVDFQTGLPSVQQPKSTGGTQRRRNPSRKHIRITQGWCSICKRILFNNKMRTF